MSGKVTIALLAVGLSLGGYVYLVELPRDATEASAQATERRLIALAESEIVRMELPLSSGEGRLVLVKVSAANEPDGAGWRIEEPLSASADAFAVDGLLTAALQLRSAFEIAEPDVDLGVYGIVPESGAIVLTPRDGEPVQITLGDETPVDDNVYVKLSTRPSVVLGLSGPPVRSLRPDLTSIRDKSLVDIPPRLVGELRVARAGMPAVTLVRTADDAEEDARDIPATESAGEEAAGGIVEGSWEMREPAAVPADSERVFRFLQELYFARGSRIIDAPGELSQYGLDQPAATVVLRAIEAGGLAPPRTLTIGQAGEKVFAQVDGRPPVLETPARLLESVPDTVFAYRDKRVMAIDPSAVAAVELTYPRTNDNVRLERDGDSWSISGDSDLSLDTYHVTDLVYGFEAMEAIGVVEPPADLAALGLDPPQVRVTLRNEDGVELGWLSLGTPGTGPGVPAWASSGSTIWRIAVTAAPIPTSYDALVRAWTAEGDDAPPDRGETPEGLGLDAPEDGPPDEQDASTDAPRSP